MNKSSRREIFFKLFYIKTSKLEETEDSSDQSDASSTATVIEVVADIEALPCENPILNSWGVAVFGREVDNTGKPRSASTSINRVEFPDLSSSLPLPLSPLSNAPPVVASTMAVWEEGAYTGYKLNCHKKKRKVDSLIELYDKDSVNTVQDQHIYKEKLAEISTAALAAVEYVNDLLAELEVNNEEVRIAELQAIKKAVTDAVKKNDREIKLEMQRILDEAAAAAAAVAATQQQPQDIPNPVTADAIRDVLAAMGIGPSAPGTAAPTQQPTATASPDMVAKLTLRHSHILEDLEAFQKQMLDIKLATEMTDSEVIQYMRESKAWSKQISDLVSLTRKFQEEALGKADLADKAAELESKIRIVKTVMENKVAAIGNIDATKGLNSLCVNKHKETVVYPDPFKGHFGENVFKFKEEIVAAIRDSQVKKADQV